MKDLQKIEDDVSWVINEFKKGTNLEYAPNRIEVLRKLEGTLSALAELEKPGEEIERAYQVLQMYGVSRERAKTIANGIDVLETRYRKDRNCFEGEKQEYAASYHAKKCAECVEKFTCETCGNQEPNGCKGCYLSDGNISNNWKPHAL
jgi:hypothetical protein